MTKEDALRKTNAELLGALENLVIAADTMRESGSQYLRDEIKKSRAALARAKGEGG